MKKIFQFFSSVLLLLFVPALSFAQAFSESDVQATEIFRPELTDPSVMFLGQIFGTVGTVLTGTSGQLLGTLFHVFNIGILIVAGVFLIWSTGQVILNTGHEGSFMGRQQKPGWVVTRTVLGIGVMVPSFTTGYSMIQVFVMWVVLHGVGFANTAWNKALDYIQAGGVVFAEPGSDISKAVNLAGTILEAQVCMYYHEAYEKDRQQKAQSGELDEPGAGDFFKAFRPVPDSTLMTISFPSERGNEDAGCGKFFWGQQQSGTLTSLIPNFLGGASAQEIGGSIGQMISNDQYAYNGLIAVINATRDSAKYYAVDPGYISASVIKDRTKAAIVGAAATWTNITTPARSSGGFESALNSFFDTARKNGWLFAGSYYYTLTSLQRHVNDATSVSLDIRTPVKGFVNTGRGNYIDFSETPLINSTLFADGLEEIVFAYQDAANAVKAAKGLAEDTVRAAKDLPPRVEFNIADIAGAVTILLSVTWGLIGPILMAINYVLYSFVVMGGDPILKMQHIGNVLMGVIITVWIAGTLLMFVLGLVANLFASISSLGYALFDAMMMFLPIIMGLLVTTFVQGCILAIYIPMVPFIIFTFTAIGWFIAVIEAMIAAPLVALGMTHPEGHDMMGKSEQALMLLLNVFLRPILMIIGLIGGMILSYVALTILDKGFIIILRQYFKGLFAFMATFSIYCGLAMTLVHVCYGLIYQIPDRVMRWIGLQTEAGGQAQQALQESKGAYEKQVQSGAEGAMKGVSAAGKAGKSIGKGISKDFQKSQGGGIQG